MFIPANENIVRQTGNISSVDVKNGQNGPYGSINIAIDDSYMKPGKNGQQAQRIERTYFITTVLNDGFFKIVPYPQVGDRISIEGKLIVEKWQDKQTGADRTAQKVKVLRVKSHISKQEREQAKSMGWCGNSNVSQQQGGFASQQQGGFASQQQGGFASQQQGGFTPQQ